MGRPVHVFSEEGLVGGVSAREKREGFERVTEMRVDWKSGSL